MIKLRQLASCIGVIQPDGSVSVTRDFFGYRSLAAAAASGPVSVRTQMALLEGRHLHLNMIRVGVENFTSADLDNLDAAIVAARSILAPAQIGIGRVRAFAISDLDATVLAGVSNSWITSDAEAVALADAFSFQQGALDVFIVLNWGIFQDDNTLGLSPVPGPCDKDDTACDNTGLAVLISDSSTATGATLAHEIGHYLGLEHISGLSAEDIDQNGDGIVEESENAQFPFERTNLMYPIVADGATQITPPQAAVMKQHCFMEHGC